MAHYHKDPSYKASIEKLHKELQEANIVGLNKMPQDVIRFNSIATIETPWNIQRSYQIVTPEKSNVKENKISILAPMGLALFGYAQGDEIIWQFPMGPNTIKILKVEQTVPFLENEKI